MTPPCAGRPDLFESTSVAAHEEARGLCAACPLLANGTCERLRRECMAEWGYGPHYGYRGTWAGVLMGTPERTVVVKGSAA